jgi:hypothetical protein
MAIDDMTSCVAWADMNGVSSAAAAAGPTRSVFAAASQHVRQQVSAHGLTSQHKASPRSTALHDETTC